MKSKYLMIPVFALTAMLVACGEKKTTDPDEHGHSHEGGEAHAHPHGKEKSDDHDHEKEVSLGSFKAGELNIEAAQAHEEVKAGEEGHLVIKLPYNDNGASVVRAWIGTEDRTLSTVGKGVYAPSHDDYDIHTMAPDPLPEDVKWWVEIEKPDGSKMVGSIAPKL